MNKKQVIEHLKKLIEDKSLPKDARSAIEKSLAKYSKKRKITKDDCLDVILFLASLFDIFIKK